MVIMIICLILAFLWLGYESDWMRVRLPAYDPRDRVKPATSEDTIPYKPSKFRRLEMPETTGNLKIICVRE